MIVNVIADQNMLLNQVMKMRKLLNFLYLSNSSLVNHYLIVYMKVTLNWEKMIDVCVVYRNDRMMRLIQMKTGKPGVSMIQMNYV